MTLMALGFGWLVLAALVSDRMAAFRVRLRPASQVLLALSASVGLATIPVAAVLVFLSRELSLLGGFTSVLTRCGELIRAVFADPLARPDVSAALLLILLWPVGLVAGTVSAWRSQSSARALIQRRRGPLVEVPSREVFAFTAGFIRPRVVVSFALLHSVAPEWRRVILTHEDAHRRAHHPLVILPAEALARGLPIAPLRWAVRALRLALETSADERAAREVGSREAVAEAIAGVALASVARAVAFEGEEVLRVRRLLGAAPPLRAHLAAVLVAGVLALPFFAAGHSIHCGRVSVDHLRMAACPIQHVGAAEG